MIIIIKRNKYQLQKGKKEEISRSFRFKRRKRQKSHLGLGNLGKFLPFFLFSPLNVETYIWTFRL
jgi:hypothetical protein